VCSARYDLVCCGHSHRVAEERVGDTLLINPGEVRGRFGRSTYVLYDTDTGEATLREICSLLDGNPRGSNVSPSRGYLALEDDLHLGLSPQEVEERLLRSVIP